MSSNPLPVWDDPAAPGGVLDASTNPDAWEALRRDALPVLGGGLLVVGPQIFPNIHLGVQGARIIDELLPLYALPDDAPGQHASGQLDVWHRWAFVKDHGRIAARLSLRFLLGPVLAQAVAIWWDVPRYLPILAACTRSPVLGLFSRAPDPRAPLATPAITVDLADSQAALGAMLDAAAGVGLIAAREWREAQRTLVTAETMMRQVTRTWPGRRSPN